MNEPPRRIWQFHLSTAILMMLAAGGFVGLNVKQFHDTSIVNLPKEVLPDDSILNAGPPKLVPTVSNGRSRGWPLTFRRTLELQFDDDNFTGYFSIAYLIADCGIGISILAVAYTGSEWLIRRAGRRT